MVNHVQRTATPPHSSPSAPDADPPRETIAQAVRGALAPGLLAWGISLLVHAGIVLLGVFIVWSYVQAAQEQELVLAELRLSQAPSLPMLQHHETRGIESRPRTRTLRLDESLSLSTIPATVNLQSHLIGRNSDLASSALSLGRGLGMAGDGQVEFIVSRDRAQSVVFVVDASGSLIDTLPFILRELQRTIHHLDESQRFTVLFFQRDKVVQVPPAGLKRATAATRQRTIDWLDPSAGHVVPAGRTDPVEAIRQALAYQPQLIYLISDNITGGGHAGAIRYELDQRRLLAEIARANRGQTRIHTMQYLYPDPLDTLRLIAEKHRGRHWFIRESDLVRD